MNLTLGQVCSNGKKDIIDLNDWLLLEFLLLLCSGCFDSFDSHFFFAFFTYVCLNARMIFEFCDFASINDQTLLAHEADMSKYAAHSPLHIVGIDNSI